MNNPTAYTERAIDIIEAYLPGPPPMSKVGVSSIVGFILYDYEDTIDSAKKSYEAVKKSIESHTNHGK